MIHDCDLLSLSFLWWQSLGGIVLPLMLVPTEIGMLKDVMERPAACHSEQASAMPPRSCHGLWQVKSMLDKAESILGPRPSLSWIWKASTPTPGPKLFVMIQHDSTWFNDMQRLSKMNKLLNQINKDIFVMIADEQTSAPRSIPLSRLGCPGALLERSGREAQWNQVRTAQGHVGSKWLKPRWVDDMLCMCVRIYNI